MVEFLQDGACRSSDAFGVHLNFDRDEFPTDHILTYCQEYRGKTCCNSSHTLAIQRRAVPYFSENVTSACRGFAVSLFCASCHPLVGSGQWSGVCGGTCFEWHRACIDSMFAMGSSGLLVPCDDDARVCWRLGDVTTDGLDFCVRSGFRAATDPAMRIFDAVLDDASAGGDKVVGMAMGLGKREKTAEKDTYCFEGSASGIGHVPPGPANRAHSHSPFERLLLDLALADTRTLVGLAACVVICVVVALRLRYFMTDHNKKPAHFTPNRLSHSFRDADGPALGRRALADKRAEALASRLAAGESGHNRIHADGSRVLPGENRCLAEAGPAMELSTSTCSESASFSHSSSSSDSF
jgi:hypothetical protein